VFRVKFNSFKGSLSMHQSFHGHDLLRLVTGSPVPLSEPELRELARQHFGESPRFHTCSQSNMTLDDLLGFLLDRGKLRRENGLVAVSQDRICGND
jgi:probable metal-binding protein